MSIDYIVFSSIKSFFAIAAAANVHPGGVHLEMTGSDVTECVGGAHRLTAANLGENYATFCDPRLNAEQSLELSFLIAQSQFEALEQAARRVNLTVAQYIRRLVQCSIELETAAESV